MTLSFTHSCGNKMYVNTEDNPNIVSVLCACGVWINVKELSNAKKE